MSERWKRWLDLITPRSGRVRCEDGTVINVGTVEQFRRQNDIQWQAVNHGASVLTIRADVTVDEFTLGVNVPSGRRLTVLNRALSLTEGVYDIDVLRSENGFTGGTEGTQAKLVDDAPDEVTARIFSGVTIDGAVTVKEELFADIGDTPGLGRPAGAPAVEEVFKRYTEDVMFRITRETGGGDYTVAMMFIVWEEEDT